MMWLNDNSKVNQVRHCRHRGRSGLVMLLVLVVVVALSVAIYSFSKHMLVDLAVGQAQVDGAQQKLLSESVVEQLMASEKSDLRGLCLPFANVFTNVSATGRPALRVGSQAGLASIKIPCLDGEKGYMATLASYPRQFSQQFGLRNESAKLNLNALNGRKLSRKQVVAKLMKYENLSEAMAEGIANRLGVFDSQSNLVVSGSTDDKLRGGTLGPALPKFTLHSMTQLLSVPGVTEELLLGEDRNANGILDRNENDGDTSWPPDNANGVLDAGWSADWTLIGAESNFQSNGERKINLNQPDLVALYDQLSQFATQEEARFVVAWRISSPTYTDSPSVNAEKVRSETENELATTFDDRIAKQLGLGARALNSPSQEEPLTTKTRAGLDLSVAPARKLSSLLDLASCQLQLIIEGKDTILVSPFANDPTSLARWLPLWEEQTSVVEGNENPNRINILQASQTSLTTVEGISDELAKAIVAQRAMVHRDISAQSNEHTALGVEWLLETGLVTTAELRQIADEITAGGDVFQGYAIGQLSSSHTASIKFIEIDGRGPALILRRSIELPPLSNALRLPILEASK